MRRVKLTSATKPGPGGRDIGASFPADRMIAPTAEVWLEVGRPKASWQQQRVIGHLRQMYPNGVPADIPRKQLLRQLGQREPALAKADLKTLRRAIKTHNSRVT
jgi:hypothetical protein